MAISFATDIRPLFRGEDIDCMKSMGVDQAILRGCACQLTRRRFTGLFRMGRCLRMNRGRRIVCRFSSSGWTRGVRPEICAGSELSGEGYSLAIISRRSAMCFLIRAMCSAQDDTPL